MADASPGSVLVLLLAVTACSTTSPQTPAPPPALGETMKLAPARQGDVPGSLVYRAPDLNTRPPPRCFYIPDTLIDTGPEAAFVDITDQQRQVVAGEVTTAFRRAIGQHQQVSSTPRQGCTTLQLYLTGVTKSVPPVRQSGYGALMQGLNVAQDPTVYGAMTIAGKFVSPDGTALAGFVNTIGTNSFSIPADASPRQVAMLTAQRLANEIAAEVDQEVAVQKSNGMR